MEKMFVRSHGKEYPFEYVKRDCVMFADEDDFDKDGKFIGSVMAVRPHGNYQKPTLTKQQFLKFVFNGEEVVIDPDGRRPCHVIQSYVDKHSNQLNQQP